MPINSRTHFRRGRLFRILSITGRMGKLEEKLTLHQDHFTCFGGLCLVTLPETHGSILRPLILSSYTFPIALRSLKMKSLKAQRSLQHQSTRSEHACTPN